MFVSMPTSSEKLLCYCLLPYHQYSSQHKTHTYTATCREVRVNAATNHVIKLNKRCFGQRKPDKTRLQAKELVKGLTRETRCIQLEFVEVTLACKCKASCHGDQDESLSNQLHIPPPPPPPKPLEKKDNKKYW